MLDKESVLKNLTYLSMKLHTLFLENSSNSGIYLFGRKLSHLITAINEGHLNIDKKKETCKWEYDNRSYDTRDYFTSCRGKSILETIDLSCVLEEMEYKFCPSCGKEIEEIKSDK